MPTCDRLFVFSAHGRTEICVIHTDHQNGKVTDAVINLYTQAVVRPNSINTKTYYYRHRKINK